MATTAPDDLKDFRSRVMTECGFTDPVEVGIVGDQAHEERGGYHISGNGIAAAGRFNSDFSTKRSPDHFLPNPYASAVDIGDNWPNGGRAAWLRFNNNVLYEMIHHPDVLTTVRAINCSTDGSNKKRYDRANPDSGVINSADTVTIHTHLEWWRNTINTAARAADLDRLIAHIRTAIYGEPLDGASAPPDTTPPMEAGMLVTCTNGSGAEKSINSPTPLTVPPNGRVVLTPAGVWAVPSASNFDSGFWQNTLWLTWAQCKELCNDMKQPLQATLTEAQYADFKASTVPIVHDAAQAGARDGLDGATIQPATA